MGLNLVRKSKNKNRKMMIMMVVIIPTWPTSVDDDYDSTTLAAGRCFRSGNINFFTDKNECHRLM
jgi:hypothetical protein